MFLVNSHNPRFSATTPRSGRKALHAKRHTFSRSYGVILPSSLTRVLSRALGYSPRPPESVCGTDTKVALYAAFLGSLGLPSVPSKLGPHHLSDTRTAVCPYRVLAAHPTGLNALSMQRARLPYSVPAYFNAILGGAGILTCFPSPTPLGLGLGSD